MLGWQCEIAAHFAYRWNSVQAEARGSMRLVLRLPRLIFTQLCWEILNCAHGQELSRCLLLAEEAEAGGEKEDNQITLHLSHF